MGSSPTQGTQTFIMNTIKETLQSRIKDPNFKSISCDDGWLHLLYQLNYEITIIDPDYEIIQIKEKFGGLRFYYKASNPSLRSQINEVVSFYESLSLRTCEITGLPGKLMHKDGRYKTLNSSFLSQGWKEVSHDDQKLI